MTTHIYKIKNADGHYWDDSKFAPENTGQSYKNRLDALQAWYRLVLQNGVECSLETCEVVPIKTEATTDIPNIAILEKIRANYDEHIIRVYTSLALYQDISRYYIVVERAPVTSAEKMVETSAEIEYIVSSKQSKFRYLFLTSMEDLMFMKIILGKKFVRAIDISTGEVF